MMIDCLRELVATWNVPALKDSFQFLDHIEKLYLMDLEHLKYYISNSPLEQLSPVPNQAHFPAHTDQEELNSYVSQRADFNRSIFSSQ